MTSTRTRKTLVKTLSAALLALVAVGSVGSAFAGDPASDQPGSPRAVKWEHLRVP